MDSSASAVVGTYGGSSVPNILELPAFQAPTLQMRSTRNRLPSLSLATTVRSALSAARRLSPSRHHAVASTQLNAPGVHAHAWIESSCLLTTEGGSTTPR